MPKVDIDVGSGWTCTCPDYYRDKTTEHVCERLVSAGAVTVKPTGEATVFRAWTDPNSWYTVSEGGSGWCKHVIAVILHKSNLTDAIKMLNERSTEWQRAEKDMKREIRSLRKSAPRSAMSSTSTV